MKIEEIIDEITKLTKEWYELIGSDHHKNRDCYWYIRTVWAYGDKPYYCIEHNGYVHDDIQKEFETHEEALLALKKEIEYAINAYKKFVSEND